MNPTDLGDYIGMESCIDLDTADHTYDTTLSFSSSSGLNRKPWGLNKKKQSMSVKELPPPLPMQTSTVLKRYHTDDGRLIIAEETIDSPKYYFTAHRSHGRLTLRLDDSKSICDKVTVDSDGSGDGKCFGYDVNAAVKVAATGACLFVEQNQHRAIRPVQI